MQFHAVLRVPAVLALFAAIVAPSTSAQGLVFTSTNGTTANEVVVFARQQLGAIAPMTSVPTTGTGTGAALGSQGAVTLSPDQQWLLVVNAGSNSITVFRVTGTGLILTDLEPSGGTQPISVTVQDGLVYVLNAGVPNNVTGFQLSVSGQLTPIANSTHALSAAATNPAQVMLSPLGNHVVVTEKGTNVVDSFDVAGDGTLANHVANASSGIGPFGFAFHGRDHVIVSEAFAGATDASAVSSYLLNGSGLSAVSASVPTTETAACWIAVTRDGRFAYSTNTGSDTISGFSVDGNGHLTLLNASGVTATTGDAPSDMAFTYRTRFLYVRNGMSGTISAYERSTAGALMQLHAPVGTLPAGSAGLAAL